MPNVFDHEKLAVYQRAIAFVGWAESVVEAQAKNLSARDQLDRASTSIPLNIAEGNGKFTSTDRCKFFDIARGSALECAACLDGLVAKRRIDAQCVGDGKAMLLEIVSMLVGLIKSNSNRAFEEPPAYGRQVVEE
ncbi:MAG: four helix bundle protein [Chthoniobacter sp.]